MNGLASSSGSSPAPELPVAFCPNLHPTYSSPVKAAAQSLAVSTCLEGCRKSYFAISLIAGCPKLSTDNKEAHSPESWSARKVKGTQGGAGVGHEFGGNVGLLGVRGVMLLLLAVVSCFRNCRVVLRPCRGHFSASNPSRHRHPWCMSRQ